MDVISYTAVRAKLAETIGGMLRFEVWGYLLSGGHQQVTRYSKAYINPAICQRDNGRVLGYDNAHDGHHRHYVGTVEQVDFVSYEDTADRFTAEWQDIVAKHSRSK
jgi:hypothetical protein